MKMARISGMTATAVILSGLIASTEAKAQNAAAAYSAYNSAFLVTSGPYYSTTLLSQGTTEAKMYTAANDIEVAEDAYQYSHSQADQTLVVGLLNRFLVTNGTDWSYDTWNDDIGWMTNIFVRGYQLTGQANYLTEAENEWNMAYNRGWDSSLGGGIWENQSKPDKEALSNDNFIFEAVQLYQLTGDSTYLTKAEAIYAWVRANLVNTTTSNNNLGEPGQVNQGIKPDGSLNAGTASITQARGSKPPTTSIGSPAPSSITMTRCARSTM
jgi:Glycosyl hydrolase family 76